MSGKVSGAKSFFERDAVKEVLVWIFQIAVVLACAVVAAIFFFQTVTMQEGSMEPTLASGDRFFINRMAYKLGSPKRGDLIVFKTSSKQDASLHIKRVIGLPGETIQIKDGQILINGETYKEGRDFPSISSPGLAEEEITIQNGEYFVLGDNRNNSDDSRYGDVGNVQKKYIEGKIWFTAGPLKKIGLVKDK
ncbi:MAG: signal peptidase I [Lachnospiraceae bacterium]|jgi:signal peptidase I|nr:signal peptidase I [Lachnospiraceae bacterium]MCI9098608.1 signal peptidase I [Lachnospiraceae bacterium]MCI9357875.1 signal peptidase I [Lachnospiraceae bacterium]